MLRLRGGCKRLAFGGRQLRERRLPAGHPAALHNNTLGKGGFAPAGALTPWEGGELQCGAARECARRVVYVYACVPEGVRNCYCLLILGRHTQGGTTTTTTLAN